MAEAILIQRGVGGGTKINGTITTGLVGQGETIKAGQFVYGDGVYVHIAASSSAGIIGIAKTSGTNLDTIDIYAP